MTTGSVKVSDDKSDDTTVARRRLVRSDASGIAVQVSLLVGAVLILGLAIWAVERAVQDVQWGNVAEWVGGVGTVGALLAAVVVFQGDTEARQAETARREQDDDDRRREQASRVTGLVVDLPRTSPTGEDPPSRLTALAHNASDAPIYDVQGLVSDATNYRHVDAFNFLLVLPGGHRASHDIEHLRDGRGDEGGSLPCSSTTPTVVGGLARLTDGS